MILRLDRQHHGWAGAGDGVFAEDLDIVGCEVLFDGVVSQENITSDAACVERLDHYCAELD